MIVIIQKNRISAVLAAVFIFLCGLSLFLFFFLNHGRAERVLFFPGYIEQDSRGEVRRLPKRDSKEEELEYFIREMILGPGEIRNMRVVPEGTELQSSLFRGQVFYIDLSEDVLFQESDRPLPLERRIALLKKSVFFNYPWVDEMIITINGEIPYEAPADLADNFRDK